MKNKKVYIISTSLRKSGNSDVLADYFMKGALEAGHDVEKVSLADREIHFCKGCLVCQQKKPCVIQDDADQIINKIKEADIVVFATPVYFYEMSGQMKTLLDRTNPLFADDYQFRDIYLLATCADQNEKSIDHLIDGIGGWIECFEKSQLKGVVKGVGIDHYGDVKEHISILEEAYAMGKKS
ncbi:flavodoxin family protein [Beduini massiliensis]|uniref:flavodoxin family protein n=1 Tax=Beduini massiliensis TaxID=1585974 RepID=UPI00059AAD1E|nr:flavodoxin family protein [Beduini massiliensis]